MDVAARGDDVPPTWLDAVRDAVVFTLEVEDAPSGAEVGVVLMGEDGIRELNSRYRGIDSPTDVLAFPCETLDEEVPDGRGVALGDIAICAPVAARQADEAGESVENELQLLAVHGALHLLGRDHDDEAAADAMEEREREILAALQDRGDRGPDE